MFNTRILIAVALLIICAVPCNAAAKKKDALTERWEKNQRLSKFTEGSEYIMYYYNQSLEKINLQESTYTFWMSKLDKPHMRGKRPGVLKDMVSVTTKWQVDCKANTSSILTASFFNAKGEQVETYSGSSVMKEPVPDSEAELVIHYMCARITTGSMVVQQTKVNSPK